MITTNSGTSVRVKLAVREVLGTTFRGGAVFSGTTEDDIALRVVATPEVLPRCPAVGEVWAVTGEVEHHARYGEQLLASECRYEVPAGRLLIRYLADSAAFEGIGEGKAKALWAAFGDRLVPTLTSGDARALEAVLTPPMAEKLVSAWLSKASEVDLMAFLDAHGFDLRLAAKLNKVWGDRARDMLDANPYYLLAFASWKPVDLAAARLGVAKDDPRRLVGAVESALYDRLQRGHTLTDKARLLRLTTRKLGGRGASEAVQLALEELAITGSDIEGFRTAGAAALEGGIADRLRAMLKGETPGQATLFNAQQGKKWAEPLIASVEREQRFGFNEDQREAIFMPFSHNFSLLTGGAGVGKTAVLRAIIKLAESQHLKVFQMALAGRAAKRMSESTGFPSMTIAKFLIDVRAERLEITSDSLVILDEASMLDLPTAYRILRVLPDGARLLLVGDPAQLAPIGFGLVFHKLVGLPDVPQTNLVEVHRQAASSGIPEVAKAVRKHQVPDFVHFEGRHAGVSFIDCDPDGTMEVLRRLKAAWKGDEWQCLCSVKGGRAGIHIVNASFHAEACGGDPFAATIVAGEPVIHLVNDYERGLMNGTLGTVIEVLADSSLAIEFEGIRHVLHRDDARDRIELAYAISVHKAQGSQFARVAVLVSKSQNLDHALLYTALTRGVDQVVFIGDRSAFHAAVKAPPLASQRSVGFRL